MRARVCVRAHAQTDVASQRQAPGRAWISFRKVSKVYTLFALISMFIRQRKIAGRDHEGEGMAAGVGEGREGRGEEGRGGRGVRGCRIVRTSSQGN